MTVSRIIIAGAGMGGLCAAIDLARQGVDVVVVEARAETGGKIRQVASGGAAFDAGPTVLTMRWVFEELFGDAGAAFGDAVTCRPLDVIARHAWNETASLDLFGDVERSADAIGTFASAAEARGFRDFCTRAQETYRTLEATFIRADQPTPISLAMNAGLRGLGDLWRISPFTTLWNALGEHFKDERLRQLFGRYATYVGSSPFESPATLMLIWDVERQGVWTIDGGMKALADACTNLAERLGVRFMTATRVDRIVTELGRFRAATLSNGERLDGRAIIVNADPCAVGTGLFGPSVEMAAANQHRAQRSLSAMTFCFRAKTGGLPLSHHNVFFSRSSALEFEDVFRYARVPNDPTVYICAQDRTGQGEMATTGAERLFCLVNAPPIGDAHEFTASEIRQCQERMMNRLARCGLSVEVASNPAITTPSDFNRLFPATGGALYGQTSHGWAASFSRPPAATRCPGVYFAGGATHPGAGVPMAALSGRNAARAVMRDLASR